MTSPGIPPGLDLDVVGRFKDAMGSLVAGFSELASKVKAEASVIKAEATGIKSEMQLVSSEMSLIKLEGVGFDDIKKAREEVGKLATAAKTQLTSAFGAVRTQATSAFTAASSRTSAATASLRTFAVSARASGTAMAASARSTLAMAAAQTRAGAATAVATIRTVASAIAQRAVAVVTRLWAAAQALLNAAMRMNPLGLIITGITLLVGLIVLAYQRSATFRAIVDGAMRGVSAAIGWVVNAAKAVFNWVKANWPLLLAILTGPIGLAVLAIVRNWDNIKAAVSAVKDWIVGRWNDVMGFLGGLPGRISTVARQMWEGFKDAVRGAINFLIDAWNRLDLGIHISIPSWVPGIGGKGLHIDDLIPDIPRLAEGGLVPRRPGGVLALLGEGNEDEVVIPLSRLNPVLGGGLGKPVTVNVYPRPGQSEYEIGRVAAREIAWAAKH
jgi:hypothetical protein